MKPFFITVTGRKTGTKTRINLNCISKYREADGGGTSFFTETDNTTPIMVTSETPTQVDNIIEEVLNKSSQQKFTP